MKLNLTLNGRKVSAEIPEDQSLLKFLRSQGCYSVKCGCETSNCGLCTVWLDDTPVLSCTYKLSSCDQLYCISGLYAIYFSRIL